MYASLRQVVSVCLSLFVFVCLSLSVCSSLAVCLSSRRRREHSVGVFLLELALDLWPREGFTRATGLGDAEESQNEAYSVHFPPQVHFKTETAMISLHR